LLLGQFSCYWYRDGFMAFLNFSRIVKNVLSGF
jgi:hypothetical protein